MLCNLVYPWKTVSEIRSIKETVIGLRAYLHVQVVDILDNATTTSQSWGFDVPERSSTRSWKCMELH